MHGGGVGVVAPGGVVPGAGTHSGVVVVLAAFGGQTACFCCCCGVSGEGC